MTVKNSDPADQPRLDPKVILKLEQDLGEDSMQVIESFIETIEELLEHLETSGVRTSRDDLHRWAHTLKSSSAMIGGAKLASVAARMENQYELGVPVDVPAFSQELRNEYRLLRDAMAASIGPDQGTSD
jgi:HPt (histidine-containing phosphotransfer) domain-containing protein